MSSVLVVGSVAFDTIHNHLGTHPRVLGGSAVFASLAAAQLTNAQLVGVVGQDYPDSAVRMLQARGIDTQGLEIADGKTFHWEGRYTDDLTSRTTLKTELNVFEHFTPKIPAAFRETPYVLLGNIAPQLQLHVLEQIERPRLVIADTMNLWIDTALDALTDLIARVDYLLINEEEARQLSGLHHPLAVAEALHALGPKTVVVKRGEYGALLSSEGEVFCMPALPLRHVADPTGAGDSFAGGFLGYLAQEGGLRPEHLRRAVVYGSALASISVQDVGTKALENLAHEDVLARVREFEALTRF